MGQLPKKGARRKWEARRFSENSLLLPPFSSSYSAGVFLPQRSGSRTTMHLSTSEWRHMSLPAGTRLGPYEILSFAAAGGMGEVYRARDRR
jgi:hypothetical protein